MRRILRKIAAGEEDSIGDVSTLADPSVRAVSRCFCFVFVLSVAVCVSARCIAEHSRPASHNFVYRPRFLILCTCPATGRDESDR